MTVTPTSPCMLPEVAEITDVPVSFPVITPVELTEAIAGNELDQVTFVAGEEPPAFAMLAVACTDIPDGIGLVGIVTDRLLGCVVVPEPDPPQAARRRNRAPSGGETDRMWQSPMGE